MTEAQALVLTELYTLRAQAGAIRSHCERERELQIAADMATIQETATAQIQRLESRDAKPPTG